MNCFFKKYDFNTLRSIELHSLELIEIGPFDFIDEIDTLAKIKYHLIKDFDFVQYKQIDL